MQGKETHPTGRCSTKLPGSQNLQRLVAFTPKYNVAFTQKSKCAARSEEVVAVNVGEYNHLPYRC